MALSKLVNTDSATLVGLATASGVYLIYNNALPNLADVRSAAPHDNTVEQSRRAAAVKSIVLIGLVFVVARNLDSYIISAGALVGIDYMYKHGNAIHPATGKLDVSAGPDSIAPRAALENAYAMPDYQDASVGYAV